MAPALGITPEDVTPVDVTDDDPQLVHFSSRNKVKDVTTTSTESALTSNSKETLRSAIPPLFTNLLRFYTEGRFLDLALVCRNGCIVKLHRLVAAACSPILEEMVTTAIRTGGILTIAYHSSSKVMPNSTPVSSSSQPGIQKEGEDNAGKCWSSRGRNRKDTSVRVDLKPPKSNRFGPEVEDETVIIFVQFEVQDLEYIVRFMYFGEVFVPQERARQVQDIAAKLKIHGFPLAGTPPAYTLPPQVKVQESDSQDWEREVETSDKAGIAFRGRQCCSKTVQQQTANLIGTYQPEAGNHARTEKTDLNATTMYSNMSIQCNKNSQESTTEVLTSMSTPLDLMTPPITTQKSIGTPDDYANLRGGHQVPLAPRKKRSSEMKRAVVLRDIRRGYSVNEIAARNSISSKRIHRWRWEQRISNLHHSHKNTLQSIRTGRAGVVGVALLKRKHSFSSSDDEPNCKNLHTDESNDPNQSYPGLWYIVP